MLRVRLSGFEASGQSGRNAVPSAKYRPFSELPLVFGSFYVDRSPVVTAESARPFNRQVLSLEKFDSLY